MSGWIARCPSWLRWGLITTAIGVGYVLLVRLLLMPLHAAGHGQPITSYLNGLGGILQKPGVSASFLIGVRGGWRGPAMWLVSLVLDLPFYFLLGLLARSVWLRTRPASSPGSSEDLPSPARRRFLTTGWRLAVGAGVAGVAYAFAEPRWFTVTRRTIVVRDLPASLDGLRLVQLTDIHHGPWLSLGYVREVVETANALAPDLVLLTGDYVLQSPMYVRPVVEELARLHPAIGTLAVLGNHDWAEGVGLARREFAAAGLPLIDNDRRVLTADRTLVASASEGLALAGVDDLWWGRPNPRRALADLPPTMPRLLLAHNPDVAEEPSLVQSGLRVDLMISGHTHGGQVVVPGFGTPFIPSRYGQKYAQGLVQGPVCPVFVCRGIGVATVPLRLGVPPEIAVLELRRG